MTIKLVFQVGSKKYKLYDFEAAQLFNKLRNYFESVGAFDGEGNLSQKEIGFKGDD